MENSAHENRLPSTLKRLFFIGLALLVVLNFFILPHEPHFNLDKYTGFWAIFGCLVTIVLVFVAKGAAHTFLGKDEDFYTKKDKTGI
jgi:hypothetical protein